MKPMNGKFFFSKRVLVLSALILSRFCFAQSLDADAQACVACHTASTPAMVSDWQSSAHADNGVSCVSCHVVDANSPMAVNHPGIEAKVSALVPPSVCAECHAEQVEQFNASGHFRAYRQQIPKDSLHALTSIHEGREHPEFGWKRLPGRQHG